jgi:hypothetical protein
MMPNVVVIEDPLVCLCVRCVYVWFGDCMHAVGASAVGACPCMHVCVVCVCGGGGISSCLGKLQNSSSPRPDADPTITVSTTTELQCSQSEYSEVQ